MEIKSYFQKIIDYLLLSTLIFFPLSLYIALISPDDPGHPLLAINFSIADLLIGLTLFLWLIKLIIYKDLKNIKLPPTPILVFLGLGLLSFVNAFSITDWLKETVQMIQYLFLFYILLLNNNKSIKLRVVKDLLLITTSVSILVALLQYTIHNGSAYLIRGLFENRNILGSFLCIMIPLAFSELLSSVSLIKKIWMGGLLVLSPIVLLSGSAIFSIATGIAIIGCFHSKKILIRTFIAIILLIISYMYIAPIKNQEALKEFLTIYEQGNISDNYYRRLTILDDLEKKILIRKNFDGNHLLITNDLFMSNILPPKRQGDAYKEENGKRHIKNQYLEMKAALNLISENALTGVGLGNFQNKISTFYIGFQKINTAEPNVHNGYLVIGSTCGILGLCGFIWMMMHFIGSSKRNLNKDKLVISKSTNSLGILGSLIAILINNFFCVIMVAPLMVPLIAIFFISENG